MKTKLIGLFTPIFLVVTLTSCSNDSSEISAPTPTLITNYSYNSDEFELARIINVYRDSIGKSPLEIVNHISYKSQEHNNYMIQNNVVNHDNFQARANNLIQVLGAITVAENIAYNFSTPTATFASWLNSPNHKKNLDGDYTHFGLSITTSPTAKKYYTTMFIKR
ncbi:MAG: CAP domain-containing protein [Bacteroidota bacterium]